MTNRYVITDSDVLAKLIAAGGAPGCSLKPDVLSRLFGDVILTTTAAVAELSSSTASDAARDFAATLPTWLLVYRTPLAGLGPLGGQFTTNDHDVELIALAFNLTRAASEVLVVTDNSDLHKALRQLAPSNLARVIIAPLEALLAHAAERNVIPDLQRELEALKSCQIHIPSPSSANKLHEFGDYVAAIKATGLTEAQFREAKRNQALMATMGLDISEEAAVKAVRDHHENGGPAAMDADVANAMKVAQQQGRSWFVVMAELEKAQVNDRWAMARKKAELTGQRPVDVYLDLQRADDRMKAKFSQCN